MLRRGATSLCPGVWGRLLHGQECLSGPVQGLICAAHGTHEEASMQSQAEGPLSSQLAASVAADSRAINITRVGNSFYHHFLQHPLSSPASSPSPASPPLLHSLSGCAPFSAASGGARSLSFWSRAKSKESLQEGISGHSSNEQEGTYTEESSQFEPSSSCGLPGGEFESPSEHLPMAVDSIEAATAVHEACEAVEAASLLAAKDDSFFAAAYFIDAITALHHQAGLPWWGSIALANVLTRMLTLPVMILSQQATSRMAIMNLDLMPLKKMQEAMAKVKTQEQQRVLHAAMLEESSRLSLQHKSAIAGTLLKMFGSISVNGLVFLSIFNGVSSLASHKAPSVTNGGMLWFTDLTVPDPYYGLPILCTLMTLAMIQYGINITGENMDAQKAGQAAFMKNMFRGMALLFLPFGGLVPSGVALLWVSNSFFSVLLGMVLRRDSVRTAVGLPMMKDLTEVSKRMQDLQQADPLSFVPEAARPISPPLPGQPAGSPAPEGLRGSNQSVQQVVDRASPSRQGQQDTELKQ